MYRYVLGLLPVLLAGCTDQEPLAPAFAGEWASRVKGCGGGPRITIGKSGITAKGMPVDGLTFTQVSVSGGTAHVVMELSPTVQYFSGAADPRKLRDRDDLRNVEILATLIASGQFVNPNNVMFRDKQTRQLRAAHPEVLNIMSLVRCDGRDATQGRSFSSVGMSRTGQ